MSNKSLEYPFNQTHPLSPSLFVSLSSLVYVVGVILALSPTVCCLCTMGQAYSTNTLTTEKENKREGEPLSSSATGNSAG